MKRVFLILSCVALLSAPSFAQTEARRGVGAGSGSGSGSASAGGSASASDGAQASEKSSSSSQTKTTTTTSKVEEPASTRFVTTLTNVQIEVTLTDQVGSQPPEKKTVSMIVASRSWGKIRSEASVIPVGESPYGVVLNVDARPFVSVDGPIQLEMTLVYAPQRLASDPKEKRPTGINQSQTVILQSGKPLIVAQAADPVSDRKVIVEVKATVLK